jgi:hypothetical protein
VIVTFERSAEWINKQEAVSTMSSSRPLAFSGHDFLKESKVIKQVQIPSSIEQNRFNSGRRIPLGKSGKDHDSHMTFAPSFKSNHRIHFKRRESNIRGEKEKGKLFIFEI